MSSERTNWGMHDNPLLTSLSLNSFYRFVFFLSFFQGICMLYPTTTLVLMLVLVLVLILVLVQGTSSRGSSSSGSGSAVVLV